MILSIHYLRGIASLLVVFYHLRKFLNNHYPITNVGDLLFSKGNIGVDIFFILSGFIISLSTKRDFSTRSFIIKRAFRIYPVYFILLCILVYLLPGIKHEDFIKSIYFEHLNYLKETPKYGYSVIYVAWTLTYEIGFYIVYMLSMALSHKHRSFICVGIIVSLMVTLQYIFKSNVTINVVGGVSSDNILSPLICTFSSPLMLEFVCGVLLFESFDRVKSYGRINPKIGSNSMMGILVVTILALVAGNFNDHGLDNYGMLAIAIFAMCLIYELRNLSCSSRILKWLGDISYSLYLFHVVALIILSDYIGGDLSKEKGVMIFMAMLIVSLAGADILHRTIEKPFIRFGSVVVKSVSK